MAIKAVIFDCFGVVLDIMRGTQIQITMDLIRELKPDYKVAMLTNAGSRYALDQRFKPGELDELFDVVVVSGDVGWEKPAPEIYTMTVEKLAVDPAEVLFIDDIGTFAEAAEKIGMHSFTFVNDATSVVAIKKIIQETV